MEIAARAPGAISYTTWNAADKTANCTLSGSNLIATAAATANFNAVRAVLGLSAGQHYWETTHTFGAGAGYVLAAGICTSAFAQGTTQLGTDVGTLSAGGPGQDGQCRFANAVAGDAGTVATGNVVRHWLDLDAGTYQCAIGAGAWVTVATGLSGTWYPCCQFTTNTHSITANFGASAFTYAVPAGARSGVYSQGASTANTLYVSSEGFVSLNTATPANTLYTGRIAAGVPITIDRQASCWVWGGNSASISFGKITLQNHDRGLDAWRSLLVRDAVVTMRYGDETQVKTPSTCALWAVAIADRIDWGVNTIDLILRDKLSILEKPLQSSTYPDSTVNETIRNTPRPCVLGLARNIPPKQIDTTLRRYDVHDDPDHILQEITDQSDPFVNVTDYTRDANGFKLVSKPIGKVAATVIGESILGAEIIGADGDFGTWVAGGATTNPQGWTVTGETSATVGVHQSPAGSAQVRNTGGGATVLLGRASTFVVGNTYFVDVVISSYTSGTLRLGSATSANTVGTEHATFTAAGTYRITVTPGTSETALVFWVNSASNSDVSIDSVDVYLVTPVQYLSDWITHLCTVRGTLVSGDLDATSISGLHTKAPYALGFFTDQAISIKEVLRQSMDAWCGWIFQDRTGLITCGRLEAPSSTPSLSISEDDCVDDLVRELDEAKGLSAIMGGVRNWTQHSDSDFVSTATDATKEKLKAMYQAVRKARGVVHATYAFADTAPIKGTLLTNATHVQQEVNRVVSLFADEANFYRVSPILDMSQALGLVLGQTVNLTWTAFDLAAGKNLLLVGSRTEFWTGSVNLRLRG